MLMGPDMVRRSVRRPLEDRARCAAYAAMAYWYYVWDWGEAVAYDGLDAFADRWGSRHVRDFVDAGVERWAASAGANPLAERMGPVGRAIARHATGEERWRALRDPIEAVCTAVASASRSPGGAFLLDAPSPLVFVDTLYAEPAALAAAGRLWGAPELTEAATELALAHARHLQDEATGLFRHYCDTRDGSSPRIHWGRGNGWALLGLADTLEALADTAAAGVADLRSTFRRACEGVLEHQVPGGGWRNIVDDPASAPESSTTALIAAALFVGVRVGALEGSYLGPAEAAWRAVEHRIDAGGTFLGVSFRPGLNSDPARYEHVPLMGNLPWGQGAYLRLAAESVAAAPAETRA